MAARTFDWEAIHRRLELAGTAISTGIDRSPEETRRILEERATAAARRPRSPAEGARLEVLTFTLAGETHGVETCHVREVRLVEDLTAVPCTPPFVAGVMSSRGEILAIIDLRKLFELPDRGLTELSRVVVLGDGENVFGLLADSVEGVCSLRPTDLQDGLPTLSGIREKFLKGVTSQMLVVLDGGRLLADAAIKVDEQVSN